MLEPFDPEDNICPPATMQPIAFAEIGDDDFATMANMMRFADAIARNHFGLDPQPPDDDAILRRIRAANKGREKAGKGRPLIPLTAESVAKIRAHL